MKYWLRTMFLMFGDVVLLSAGLVLAYYFRLDVKILNMPILFRQDFATILILNLAVKLACFWIFYLYSSLWRFAGTHELLSIAKAVFVSNLILESFVLLARTRLPGMLEPFNLYLAYTDAPRSIFALTIFVDFALIAASRFIYGSIRRAMKGNAPASNIELTRVLILGGGATGANIIREMERHPALRSEPVAVIDDDKYLHGKKLRGVPIIGGRELLQETVKKYMVDEIIIAISSAGKKLLADMYDECAETGCKIKILPSVGELIDESAQIQKVRDVNVEDLLGRKTVLLDDAEFTVFLKNQAVMVTGGGGSIGSELCRQIAHYAPSRLIVLDNYENGVYDLQQELRDSYPELKFETIIANIRDAERIESIFAKYKPNVVFHAAAHKHVPLMEDSPSEAIKNNVFGTRIVAECAGKFRAKKFILISTDKAVNPTNIMGATKRLAEMLIQGLNQSSSTEYVAVRFGNVLGSNGSVVPLFKRQIARGGPLTVTHPDITRFFMTTPEAAQLVLQAGSIAKGGEIFVLDMGEPVKIYDMAKEMIRLSGFELGKDISIKFTGLRPGEKLYEELLMAEEGLQATKLQRIFVAQPGWVDFRQLIKKIDLLQDKLMEDPFVITDLVAEIVHTYKKL